MPNNLDRYIHKKHLQKRWDVVQDERRRREAEKARLKKEEYKRHVIVDEIGKGGVGFKFNYQPFEGMVIGEDIASIPIERNKDNLDDILI